MGQLIVPPETIMTIWIGIVIFFAIVLAFGVYAKRYTKTVSDYYIAGRRFGVFTVSAALGAAAASGWGAIGVPGGNYAGFMQGVLAPLGWVLAIALGPLLFGRKLSVISQRYGAMTVPDAAELLYGGKWIRLLVAIVVISGLFTYIGAQMKALGHVFETLLGIPYAWGVMIGLIVVIVYCFIGGIMGVFWTVFVLATVAFSCQIILIIYLSIITGGLGVVHSTLATIEPKWFLTRVYPVGGALLFWWSYLMLFFFAQWGSPNLLQRYYAVKRTEELKWVGLLYVLAYMIGGGLIALAGDFAKYFAIIGKMPTPPVPDLAMPYLLVSVVPAPLAALVFCGILALTWTSVDAMLLNCAFAMVRDLHQSYIAKGKLTDRQVVILSRVWLLVFAVIAAVIYGPVIGAPPLIMFVGAIGLAQTGIIAMILGGGFYWRRSTRYGAYAGLIASFLCYIIGVPSTLIPGFKVFVGTPFSSIPLFGPTLGLFIAIFIYVVVSLMTSPELKGPKWEEIYKI